MRRDAVEAAIAAGTTPAYPRGSQNFSLKLAGGKRAVLVKGDGTFTPEGEWWSAKSGQLETHAGARPFSTRCTQNVHFSITPLVWPLPAMSMTMALSTFWM